MFSSSDASVSVGRLSRCAGYGIVGLAVALGIYLRFKGNGLWSLSGDEYHTAQTVRNILAYKLPVLPCGGYYVRGLLHNYVLAGALLILPGSEEAILRSVTALISLLALPPLFLLGRRMGGTGVGWGAVALFSLSIWEIETARYARMYGPFIAIFVWYLWFLFKALLDGDEASFNWLYVLSAGSVFIYEGGIFLALLNFVPFVLGRRRISFRYLSLPVLIMALNFAWRSVNWRHLGGENYLPPDYQWPAARIPGALDPLTLPDAVFVTVLRETPAWAALFVLLLALFAAVTYLIARSGRLDTRQKLLMAATLLFALLHQYALVVYAVLLFWLLDWFDLSLVRQRAVRLWLGALTASLVFWSMYGLLTSAWHSLYPVEVANPARKLLVAFLEYPDVFGKVVYQWWIGQPTTTLAMGLIVIFGIVIGWSRVRPDRHSARLLLAIVVALAVLMSAIHVQYRVSRYTLFLHPLLLILSALGAKYFADAAFRTDTLRAAGFAGLLLSFIVVADDYDVQHMANISAMEVNFRTNYSTARAYHLWSRYDYQTPAEFINERAGPGKLVVATARPIHHDLDKLDVLFMGSTSGEFAASSAHGGTKEVWTCVDLMHDKVRFHKFLEERKGAVLLAIRTGRFPYQDVIEKELEEKYAPYLVYQSIDGRLNVYELTAK